jgi:hypothetical protein
MSRTTTRETIVAAPANTPCSVRITSSTARFGDSAHPIEART